MASSYPRSSSEKWLVAGLGQKINKISLELIIKLDIKYALKDSGRPDRKKGSRIYLEKALLLKMGQCGHL